MSKRRNDFARGMKKRKLAKEARRSKKTGWHAVAKSTQLEGLFDLRDKPVPPRPAPRAAHASLSPQRESECHGPKVASTGVDRKSGGSSPESGQRIIKSGRGGWGGSRYSVIESSALVRSKKLTIPPGKISCAR